MGHAEFNLYFSTESAAQDAAARLDRDGYSVTVHPGADKTDWLANNPHSWLVLARRSIADADELDHAEEALDQLAADFGGEFDGHDC
jgi:hypothetical protein